METMRTILILEPDDFVMFMGNADMEVLHEVGGISFMECDQIRKDVIQRNVDKVELHKQRFINRCHGEKRPQIPC
jgi:hypothetical protein